MTKPAPVKDDAVLSPALEEFVDAPGAEQITYRVTFERVGRWGGRDGTRPPEPLTARVLDADGLADRIEKYVRPYLRSAWPEASLDLTEMRGTILCGFNNGGTFTIERLSAPAAGGVR